MYQPEKLKARRKELKLTQKEIAEQLGISFQAYSAWERGVKEPSEEKVTQLEKILKVPKGYFTQIEIVRLYTSLHTFVDMILEKFFWHGRYLLSLFFLNQVASIDYHFFFPFIGKAVIETDNFDLGEIAFWYF